MPPPYIVFAGVKILWALFIGKPGRNRRGSRGRGGSSVARSVGWLIVLASFVGVGSYFLGLNLNDVKGLLKGQALANARASAQSGPIQVYFTNPPGDPNDPNDPTGVLVGIIRKSQSSIDVAGFEINNTRIIEALVEAHQRGVTVRVVTDTDYIDRDGPIRFAEVGIPVVDDRRSALMHNKFMVFDNRAVWTGSMNFTENCAYRNNNNGIYVEIPEVAANFATKFDWFFEERKFGGKPSRSAAIPNPIVELPDGTVLETYFSTHDGISKHLLGLIEESRQSIDFLAFSFTHKEIADAMLDRSRSGVEVRGVFEKSQTGGGFSQFDRLQAAGLQVYTDANPRNMHHKVMIFDRKNTLTGSFNFSQNADRSNDENVLIIRNNPAIADRFGQEFLKVFQEARDLTQGLR